MKARLPAIAVAGFIALEFPAPWSLVLALFGGWLTVRSIALLEPAAIRRTRLRMAYLAPDFAELIALSLESGLSLVESIEVSSEVVGEPVKPLAIEATGQLRLGAPPRDAFSSWHQVPALQPIANTIGNSIETGAQSSAALRSTALRLRRSRTNQVRRQVQAVGVRAALPIGLCFLPSFILGAVFPIAAQLFTSLLASLPTGLLAN